MMSRDFEVDGMETFAADAMDASHAGLSSVVGKSIRPPANPYGSNYRRGMRETWPGQEPVMHNDNDKTGYSQLEITYTIQSLLTDVSHQFEFVFLDKTAKQGTMRDNARGINLVTLHTLSLEGRKTIKGDPSDPSKYTYEEVLECKPLGVFFAFTDKQLKGHSQPVAISCGGLNDVLNTFHVPLFPGIRLFYVLLKLNMGGGKPGAFQIVPYASDKMPMAKDFYKDTPDKVLNMAIVEVGQVAVCNSITPHQVKGAFLCNERYVDIPIADTTLTGTDSRMNAMNPEHPKCKGNFVRVHTKMFCWKIIK